MAIFRLVLCPDAGGALRTIEFEADDAAGAFAYVDRQSDFVHAEIWQGEELLARGDATPATGKLWTVKPAAGRSVSKYMPNAKGEGERP